VETKQILVGAFLAFEVLHNVAEIEKFIARIDAFANNLPAPDIELDHMILLLHANKEAALSTNFIKCQNIIAPIFEWLKNKTHWSYLHCHIFSMAVSYAQTYKLANTLTEKAVEMLQRRYLHEEKHKFVIYTTYTNMTYRLLRAKYYDIQDRATQKATLEEIENFFDRYMRSINAFAKEKKKKTHLILFEVREGIFYNDSERITTGLTALRKSSDTKRYKATCNEVIEYMPQISNLTVALNNVFIGRNLRHHRKRRGLSAHMLADALGTDVSVVYAYESGRRGISRSRLISIAKILKIKVSDLDGSEDKDPIPPSPNLTIEALMNIMEDFGEKDQSYVLQFAKQHLKYVENE